MNHSTCWFQVLMIVLLGILVSGCGDDTNDGVFNTDTSTTTDTATDSNSDTGTDTNSDTNVDTDMDGGSDGGDELALFGGACAVNADCASKVCQEFGQLGWVCTLACTQDADCPVGSQGQKCNQQGYCRP